jgi:hypothetical protein
MKTITFTNRPEGYGCSEPGNNAGEYVRAEVAKELLRALKTITSTEYSECMERITTGVPRESDYDFVGLATIVAASAITKAEPSQLAERERG